jgi:hypothetical protein
VLVDIFEADKLVEFKDYILVMELPTIDVTLNA